MRYENALYFTNDRGHRARDPPPSRTASFGATVVCGCFHRRRTLGELPGGGFVGILVARVWWPAEQDFVVLCAGVGQNLKDAGEHAGLWAIAVESLVKERELLWTHCRRATPVCPRRLVLFVIVCWSKVDYGMDEAENESLGGPANYNVDCHVVVVHSDLVAVAPLWKGASIAEKTANPRKAAVPDPGERVGLGWRCQRQRDGPRDSAMHCSVFECLCQVGLGRRLFLGVDKVEEGLSDEELCLIFEMACEDRVQVDELQIGR